jgi:Mg2+/Co2+ transporter CorB
VLSLPKTVGLALLAGLLAGLAVGIILAVLLLRAADTAAMQYHRAEIAAILDASSATHQIVHEIVANAHTRIALLQMELKDLQEVQR